MAVSTTNQGTPNWADCATTDLPVAENFYAQVFGWTSERMAGSDGNLYSLQRLDGHMVCGIYEFDERLRSMNVPPHWGTYVQVDDVDATLEAVKEAGGTVPDLPVEEPEVGKIGIIQDPVGAFLRIWHPAPEHGAEVLNVPGALTWFELNTKDPETATTFYERVLGVEIDVMGGPTQYTLIKVGGRPVAGILKTTPEMGEFPSSWDVYFASDDVDQTASKIVGAGGKLLREPWNLPGEAGRMLVAQDPPGAVFEVIKMPQATG